MEDQDPDADPGRINAPNVPLQVSRVLFAKNYSSLIAS